MIQFDRFVLENGLRVLVHKDNTTPMVAVNVMYDVGAKDENPNQTGFAHLFEHLMFGGSINIENYDEPLQMAGGENNAYTTNDLTNYYIQLPLQNIETAFWLESDRMLSLAFNEKSLDVQRKVVCEEFKEHYINKPYGDLWKIVRELSYTKHPYQWMTIGKELSHIENAQLQDVKNFFKKHYNPSNAILCVAGNIKTEMVKELTEKWFGSIPSGEKYIRNIENEPTQTAPRKIEVERQVPVSVIVKAYHIGNRLDENYQTYDAITEVLSGGQSSRLYQTLVKEKKLFSTIDCYHLGSVENGLIVIEGKVLPHITIEQADEAIENLIDTFLQHGVEPKELEKAINKVESLILFEDMPLLSRANNLAFYELLGDATLINDELNRYKKITKENLDAVAKIVFDKNNSNTVYYKSNVGGDLE